MDPAEYEGCDRSASDSSGRSDIWSTSTNPTELVDCINNSDDNTNSNNDGSSINFIKLIDDTYYYFIVFIFFTPPHIFKKKVDLRRPIARGGLKCVKISVNFEDFIPFYTI